MRIEGRTIPQPRLSSWYGEVVHSYSTLAHTLRPYPFTPLLERLKSRLEEIGKTRFNSLLANLQGLEPPDKGLLNGKTTATARRSKTSFSPVLTDDRTINTDLERYFAKRMNAQTVDSDSGTLGWSRNRHRLVT